MTDCLLARGRKRWERTRETARRNFACVLMLLWSANFAVAQRIAPPRTVKIGVERYSIAMITMSYGHSGFTDNATRYVFIAKGQNLCDEQDTVLHELFHAALGTSHSADMQTLHDWIFDSATPYVDLLRDNPQLVKYLLQPRSPCRSTGR